MTITSRLWVSLAILATIGVGCGRTDKQTEPEAKQPAQESTEKNWQPESTDLPAGHTPDDGHDHSAHGGAPMKK